MDQERLIKLLNLEFEYLQKSIDKFDTFRFAIKGWTVTTVGLLIAAGITTKNALVPALGLFVIFFFAYMELVYLDMQINVIRRCEEIDGFLHDPNSVNDDYRFGIRQAFLVKFRVRNIPNMLSTRPEVYNFYLGLSMSSSLATLLTWAIR